MRILHIDSGREWRGGQRQVYLLARGQRAAGDEPIVIGQPEGPLVRRLRGVGAAASAVRMRGEWDLAAARRIRAQIRGWRPHIVHAHDARSHALAMAALIGVRGVPLVVTRRVINAPRGRLKYGSRVARFIAISAAVREALVTAGVDPRRVDVVHSGVPAPRVAAARDWRVELGWPADAVVCGIVGAMTAEKGIGILHDVAARLPDDVREHARLVLLGGHARGRESIEGLEAFRAGFVDEIHAAMAGLDILWHPSSAEGLGTSVIDAMALRVPPVAFAVGGLPELVDNEHSGLLVPAGNVAAFAAAVARLVRDAPAREQLAAAGPARAAEFSVERMIEGSRAAYARVL
ncbi:MAG: glycosyltransferase family 4 protein [Gemmatimonadaceae bacterium]|nr:glycosyltransferase family 4 protein [Gemmatimonadaceae bacterium]